MAKGRKEKPRDDKKLVQKDIFTTFDVSRVCQANIASIKNWIMKGYLRAFRTPGGHYRIQKKDLVNFLRKYHMPNPFSGEMLRLYFYSKDAAAGEKYAQKLAGEHEAFAYASEAELFLAIGEETPDALLVDVDSFTAAELAQFVGFFVSSKRFEGVRRVALAADETPLEGFHRVAKKAAPAKRLVELIQEVY